MAKNPPNYRRTAALALLFSLLLVFAVGWFSHRAWGDLLTSFQWILRSQRIEREANDILAEIADAESAQRGFLLTHKTRYLEPFAAARAALPGQFERLKKLVADDPSQKEHITLLQELTEQRLRLAERSVALSQNGSRSDAIALVETDQGQDMMDKIRAAGARIIAEEDRQLALRNTGLLRQTRRYEWAASAISAVHFLFLAGVAFLLWRLTKMHNYLTMCAWTNTVEYEGEWISFEEYLHRRFGIDVSHGLSPVEADRLLAKAKERDAA